LPERKSSVNPVCHVSGDCVSLPDNEVAKHLEAGVEWNWKEIGGSVSLLLNVVAGYFLARQKLSLRGNESARKQALEASQVEHAQHVKDRKAEQKEKADALSEYKQLLDNERALREKVEERCDKRISNLESLREEDRKARDDDRSAILSLKAELLEVQNMAERAESGAQELERQLAASRAQVSELQARVAHLHESWRNKPA